MFLRWCVGRAILDQSPAEGVPTPTKEVARDRVLTDEELARIILGARRIDDRYGGIVELLALSGQRREEVASGRNWTLADGFGRFPKNVQRMPSPTLCTCPTKQ